MMRCLVMLVVSVLGVSVARADDPPLYACKERTGKITATFAPETTLKDLATWVLGFTCKNIVIDSEVLARTPKVTVIAPNAMTVKQALQLFVDSVEATGMVVTMKKDTIVVKLGPNMPRSCPSVASTSSSVPTTTTTATTAPESSPEMDEVAAALDAGIKKVSDTQYEISTSLVDKILANPMAVSKGARVVPAVKDGKPDGFKLYAIRPSSVYAKLGLANGDTLQKINGYDMTSADKALEIYTKLRDAKSIVLSITRRGKPVTLTYIIK